LVNEPDADLLCPWCLSQYLRTTRVRDYDVLEQDPEES
jgi:hypothetical protein